MDMIYSILFIIIVLAIIFFIYQSFNRNSDGEDFEYDGSSSTKIRHGNL